MTTHDHRMDIQDPSVEGIPAEQMSSAAVPEGAVGQRTPSGTRAMPDTTAASETRAMPDTTAPADTTDDRAAMAPADAGGHSVVEPAHSVTDERGPSQTDASSADSLFAGSDLTGLRTRWDDVQAGFVDDPREAVQNADGLVAEVIEELTSGFASARSRLEEQWARGEQASTEDLRLALKRYREFFQRLLAV
jgi:hypothetical protein